MGTMYDVPDAFPDFTKYCVGSFEPAGVFLPKGILYSVGSSFPNAPPVCLTLDLIDFLFFLCVECDLNLRGMLCLFNFR